MKLKGINALVTGATGGMGSAIAERLVHSGVNLILTGRKKDHLEKLTSHLKSLVPENESIKIIHINGDLNDPRFIAELRDFVLKNFGDLHLLINNAGITAHGKFIDTIPEVLRKTMEINFFSIAELTQVMLPVLLKTHGQKMIVYTSTPSGFYGIPERSAYSASKAAGNALMESLRTELAEDHIKTLIFAPGYTETNLRNSVLSAKGEIVSESQAKGAKSPGYAAEKLVKGIEKNRRIVFTDKNGLGVYLLRVILPGFLERMIIRKTLKKP
jgi:short-subunit dehydrogenase